MSENTKIARQPYCGPLPPVSPKELNSFRCAKCNREIPDERWANVSGKPHCFLCLIVSANGTSPLPVADNKINPSHYKNDPSGIEAIQITRHRVGPISNAIKYLWRAGLKPGEEEKDDLNKVLWYVADYMQQQGYPIDLGAFKKHAGISDENYQFVNGTLTINK